VTSVITACGACGEDKEALKLLAMMEDMDIPRTVWSYNAAISACAKKGNWKGALSVYEKLRENALELNNNIINDDENDKEELILDVDKDDDIDQNDETDEEIEEGEEEIGWNENDNVDFDIINGTGDYDLYGDGTDKNVPVGVEEVGLFHAIKGIANQVTYNTLIEALGIYICINIYTYIYIYI
jgi:pentatricopeptide repeat protein